MSLPVNAPAAVGPAGEAGPATVPAAPEPSAQADRMRPQVASTARPVASRQVAAGDDAVARLVATIPRMARLGTGPAAWRRRVGGRPRAV